MSIRESSRPSPFTFTFRKKLVESYSEFISELKSWNWDAYYFSFMFDHISGGESQRKERMFSDVKRAHDILSRHIVRKPQSEAWKHLLPVFIVCPDYPVPKKEKSSIRVFNANDGLHMNAVAVVPPRPPSYLPREVWPHWFSGKQSRLKEPLDVHFQQRSREYRTEKLYRIHVTPITKGDMIDYTLKNFKNGRIGYDDIRVF
jgi:hypothetical protein